MNKTVKRALALLLAALMMVSVLAACGNDSGSSSESSSTPESSSEAPESSEAGGEDEPEEGGKTGEWAPPTIDSEDYDEISEYYYNYNVGGFYETYEHATEEVENLSLRWANEAIAEAKLMETGMLQPTTCGGGMYALSRSAPGSYTSNNWGSDSSRYQYLIITEEILTLEDRNALKDMLNEMRGTGEYRAAAQKYLTDKGYHLKDNYHITFSELPTTWDVLASSRAADTEPVLGAVDSLLFYDGENRELPSLAESYDVSDDGLTYTFHIRKGVKWVDNQGREIADVVADDWIAGLQHLCDSGEGLEALLVGIIGGIEEYVNGEADFDAVTVEAADDYTLVYHLEKPIPYFTSMLHYSLSLPMCRSYYTSQGGKFGEAFDPSAENYTYGTSPETIAYCGPFLITNATEGNSINYVANPTYWDAASVTLKEYARLHNDGSDVTKAYYDLKAGIIDNIDVNASALELAKTESLEGDTETIFDKYVFTSATNVTSYINFFNVNRATWANARDDTEAVSVQTEEDAARTHIAMNNQNFRLALCMAIDRTTWNAQGVGDELATLSVRNSYTPATFVSLTEDVTVQINGEDKTFPAGTDYGEIMQAQIDADGYPITVYKLDSTAENGRGTGDGFDGWYSVENANKYMDMAIAELETAGLTIDESNPIQVDLPFASNSTTYTNKANAYKQSVESSLGGKVIVNLVDCPSYEVWYYTGYNTKNGAQANYDMYDLSGWGPDFMDPCSYLDTFLPYYNGYMTKCIGVF